MATKVVNLPSTWSKSLCLIWSSTPGPHSKKYLLLAGIKRKWKLCSYKSFKASNHPIHWPSYTCRSSWSIQRLLLTPWLISSWSFDDCRVTHRHSAAVHILWCLVVDDIPKGVHLLSCVPVDTLRTEIFNTLLPTFTPKVRILNMPNIHVVYTIQHPSSWLTDLRNWVAQSTHTLPSNPPPTGNY